ncbi:MAG: tRNA uridine(34) 5-carboxymethylaminomethyl modification radical SAM/GNAT enzyme Elp3, partial [Thermoproteota archaeon]|nr:tRNA uridine(34) 5-carboxymethylaminomethyl modification radical SAM/GNAT enzyme Elp3 [Thermoproteota archaeon]
MLSSATEKADENDKRGYLEACKAIALQLESNKNFLSIKEVFRVIKQVASDYNLDRLPRNEDIIRHLQDNYYRHLLMVKPTKTASGVAVIAVMPKPYACPHGRCIYCPGGLEFNTPLSYTGTEPATKVAQRVSYDPYQQVRSKMEHLQSRGHDTGKTEIVVVGGTFPFMPADY